METFSALLAICVGNSPVTGEFPSQRPVTRKFDVFRTNGWVNNPEAGDLRRHRAHYDVTAVLFLHWTSSDKVIELGLKSALLYEILLIVYCFWISGSLSALSLWDEI